MAKVLGVPGQERGMNAARMHLNKMAWYAGRRRGLVAGCKGSGGLCLVKS